MRRKRVGIFSFACCEGCQLQILDLGKELLELMKGIDIIHFRLAEEYEPGNYHFDVAIVEGAITKREEERELRDIRNRSDFLISIGACAVTGGIPSLKNLIEIHRSGKVYGIDKFVKVDYHIPGCPIEGEELRDLVINLLAGKIPQETNHPVCMECTEREISCLLLKGIPCLGPVTTAGCGAICPSINTPCEGCRGIHKDANVDAIVKLLRKAGLGEKEIKNKLNRFSETVMERLKNERDKD